MQRKNFIGFVSFFTCLISTVFFSFIDTAYAATEEEFTVAINLSGRQRMLSQKMSKEFLLILLKINEEANKGEIKKTITTFDKTLNNLIGGDKDLNIPVPPSSDILNQLNMVKSLWKEFKTLVESEPSPAAAIKVAVLNVPLLIEMNKAVGMYEGESKKAGIKNLGTVVNIAGRQRMLTQKMSKEILLITLKVDTEKNMASLKDTYSLFARSHKGLIKGDTEMGLPPTTNNDILKQMGKVEALWDEFKVPVEHVIAAKGDISPDLSDKMAGINVKLLIEMNKAVTLYEAEAK